MKKVALATRDDHMTKMVLGIALAALTMLSGRLATPLAAMFALGGQTTSLLRTIIRAVVATVCVLALGGGRWLIPSLKKTRDAWRFTRPLVIIHVATGILTGALGVAMLLLAGEVDETQMTNIFFVSILCIFVGLNEEFVFRGLLFGGLLAKLGNQRKGPLMAAIISSVLFGFAHVMYDIDYTNPLSILQGLFKTIQSGLVGFILCTPMLEGRNLIGVATVHGFFDWSIMLGGAYRGELPSGTYVNSNEHTAVAALVFYGIFIALYLPKSIASYKRLSTLPLPQYGPFIASEKSAALVNSVREDTAGTPAHMGERAHRVFDNRYAALLATPLFYMAVINIVTVLLALVLGEGTPLQIATAIVSVAISLAILINFSTSFFKQFDGVLGWSKAGMLMALPGLGLALANIPDWFGASLNNPLLCIVLALAPGVSEEILFRAIPLSNWMRVRCTKDGVIESVVATSLAFGLIHGINFFAGAAGTATIFQVVYAICIGALYAAVLVRSGSIVPCIILHTLTDFLAFMTMDMNAGGLLTQELVFNGEFWFAFVMALVALAWAAWLLRPSKQQEVVELWKTKWHKR